MTISDGAARSRVVVLVAFDDGEVLDVTGPASVFAQAGLLAGGTPYRIRVAGPGERAVLWGGVALETEPLARVRGPVDTVLVGGGVGVDGAGAAPGLAGHVARLARRARRVGSVCSGALVLGQAGLLEGRRATTHWMVADRLAAAHPGTRVEPDRIYVRDGPVWTSAGVTAGIDLALAMVADDLGGALAHDVARLMVLPVRRAGGQSQYSPQLAAAGPGGAELADLLAWVEANVDGDLSVAALARRAGWGQRHLGRRFREATGTTPARYVESLRLDLARQLLETTSLGVGAVARRCGFGSREVLHRAFRRRLGTSPAAYRRAFAR